ncbi:saccharopine dehydrogenase NADP-binding domain-containing protein [candidate division KSB1 bacterium]|nr:saccharopine dehydrogenase NADP-binding domain-containing protein [candidate division KSB1 bacterium]
MKILVLGAGRVGRVIAIDLNRDYQVTCIDSDPQTLKHLAAREPQVRIMCANAADHNLIMGLAAESDLVVNALPGHLGFQTLRVLITAGKPIVDISFFAEDPFELEQLTRRYGVTAIVDCGIAPGLCNLLLGHHIDTMQVERYVCYVGGLPVKRSWPYQYKAPFSPIDVLEEYIRPARMVVRGEQISKPALSDPEIIQCDKEIGALEAFNTDGLRTLLHTMNVPNMKEKTLRYPGHREIMRVFVKSGFLSKTPIDVAGGSIRPIDMTSALLFPKWLLEEGEQEFTVMRVEISGREDGKPICYEYGILDRTDRETQTTSMARTTGYCCTAAVRLLLQGLFAHPGICPPETIGRNPEAVAFFIKSLAEHRIFLHKKIHT